MMGDTYLLDVEADYRERNGRELEGVSKSCHDKDCDRCIGQACGHDCHNYDEPDLRETHDRVTEFVDDVNKMPEVEVIDYDD